MEAWVYYNGSTISTAGYTDIFLTNVGYGMLLYNGVLTAYNLATGNPAASSAIPANTWVHLAIVKSGSTVTGYQNGTQVLSGSGATDPFPASGNFIIGSWTNGTSEFWTGYISNVRLSNTVRYSGSFTPSTTPFTSDANTLFLACQSATFVDNSTNNFTITANGNSVPTQFNPFGWTNTTGSSAAYSVTNYGGSMYFDGSGDYLTSPSNTAFAVGTIFTFEMWIYPTASPNNTNYFVVNTSDGFQVGFNGTSAWGIANATVAWLLTTSTLPVLNAWNHIAICRTGTGTNQTSIYLNGVQVANGTVSTGFTTAGVASIGGSSNGTGPFTGYISNVRLVKGQALYTSNFAPPVAPLSFNANAVLQVNGTSAAIYDSSMIATYETLGNASSTTVIKKYGNSSMSFDGTGDYLKAPWSPTYSLPGNFTVEAWVYLTSAAGTGSNQTIASYQYNNSNGTGFWGFYLNGSGPYTLYFNTQGANHASTTTVSIPLSTWTHVAYSRSGSTGSFFVNGTIVGTGVSDTSTYSGTTGSLFVGIMADAASAPLYGYLDDLRITNGVARYTANFTPPTTPFIQF
jgi:hypothetical protein